MSTTITRKKVTADNATLTQRYSAAPRSVNVFPLDKLEADMRQELEQQQAREREYLAERIEALGKTRQAMMLLDAVPDVQLNISTWTYSAGVRLGFFPQTRQANRQLADILRAIRKALGCSLGRPAMNLEDAETRVVSFTFNPSEWPGVWLTFYRRMPRTQTCRCRIVTEKSVTKRLVCEVTPR